MAKFLSAATVAVLVLAGAGPAAAEDRPADQITNEVDVDYKVVNKEGLNFRVPVDMPIEKRNGIIAPISTEEYIHGKFKRLDKRLDGIEQKIDEAMTAIRQMQKEKAQAAPCAAEPKGS
ncbi:MAG: hypothetical protein HYZ52_06930 [Candidatus Omnitrophica bacterium]|nr:hypothetical protein [Candidatus Omnitrophota bacterium]